MAAASSSRPGQGRRCALRVKAGAALSSLPPARRVHEDGLPTISRGNLQLARTTRDPCTASLREDGYIQRAGVRRLRLGERDRGVASPDDRKAVSSLSEGYFVKTAS
ncbi:unnamed protein product [Urochloa humidicola]